MLGAKHFVASGLAADVDGAIVCEPEAGEICAVAKGALRLRVDFTGKMAHGAMPHHGRNPIQAVAALLVALRALEADLQGPHPRARAPRRGVRDADRAARRDRGADERHPGDGAVLRRRAHDPRRRPRAWWPSGWPRWPPSTGSSAEGRGPRGPAAGGRARLRPRGRSRSPPRTSG